MSVVYTFVRTCVWCELVRVNVQLQAYVCVCEFSCVCSFKKKKNQMDQSVCRLMITQSQRDRLARASDRYCNTLQHTATHCNTLQHTATSPESQESRRDRHCKTPHHTATQCICYDAHTHMHMQHVNKYITPAWQYLLVCLLLPSEG